MPPSLNRKTEMNPDTEWPIALRDAQHPRAVMDAVLAAIGRIPAAQLQCMPAAFTPRTLNSRADVEHWHRRLEAPNPPSDSTSAFMRAYFAAALLRLDEIGPARRPQ